MAGSHLTARVVVDNNTGHALRVEGCGSLFAIALTSGSYHPSVGFPACLQILTVPAGTSTHRVAVLATYLQCGMDGASRSVPACLPGKQKMPPLPPGRYRAVLFFGARQFAPAPPPVPVLVTPR